MKTPSPNSTCLDTEPCGWTKPCQRNAPPACLRSTTIRRLAGDGLVSSLLVLHGLHPDDIETRVIHALGKTHGNAELLGVVEGVVRVRLTGSGCGLRDGVETALREAVPDAVEIIVEESLPTNNFVPLSSLGNTVQIA